MIDPSLEYQDAAISGTKLHRQGLDQLREAARRSEFGVVLFFSLSRLARESVISMPVLKELVYNYHIRVISVSEGIDSDRTEWDMLATIFSMQHERYVKELSANVFRGQEGTVLSNFSVGDLRFGYTSVPSPDGQMSGRGRNAKPRMVYRIDEDQAAWVRRIFDWFVSDRQPVSWIVRELNQQNATRDQRSITKKWTRAGVIGVLRSPKYVGVWPWGQKKNIRNPLNGRVSQDERSEEECEKWTRHFPDLRVIDDLTFDAAQQILDENNERCQQHRDENGKLRGSSGGNGRSHLLADIIRCGKCNRKLHTGGSYGKYLICPGARDGVCDCRTQLPRDVAQRMILDVIGERIGQNPTWVDTVFDVLSRVWQRSLSDRPDEADKLKKAFEACEVKIKRLLDLIEESDQPDLEIKQRLEKRRVERHDLQKRLKSLESVPCELQVAPTREWLVQQLENLGSVIQAANPAAAKALQGLLCGDIVVDEVAATGKKRRTWIGTLVLHPECFAKTAVPSLASSLEHSDDLAETISLDFHRPTKADTLGDAAWTLYEQGHLMKEIARSLDISRSRATNVLQAAALKRGETIVDGRKRRSTLSQKTVDNAEHLQLVEDSKRLYDDGLLNQDIAKRLNVCRDQVTRLLQEWHTTHGVKMPDGRARAALLIKQHSTEARMQP